MNTTSIERGTRFTRNGKLYEVSGFGTYTNRDGIERIDCCLVKNNVRTNYASGVPVADVLKGATA